MAGKRNSINTIQVVVQVKDYFESVHDSTMLHKIC